MSKWLCCPLETIQTSVAVSAYVVFWNMWQKLSIAAIRKALEKQAGNLSASNPLFLLYTSTVCASISVHSQDTSEMKTQNETLKFWQPGRHVQGRSRDTPGISRLGSSELTQQLLWAQRHVWESPQKAHTAKRFPQHVQLETNHHSFFTTKASATIIHPNLWSLFSLILVCQSKPKHTAFRFQLAFPGHTMFSSGYGVAE